MKRIVRYTSYEGNSVDQTFIGVDAYSLDAQEFELDEHYHRCYGVGGYTKETIRDDSFYYLTNNNNYGTD